MFRIDLKSNMNILYVILWIACIISIIQAKKKPKLITTFIDAKWNQTPLILEIAEFLAEENSHSFWKFIDGISSLDVPFHELDNEKIKYETAINEASKLISETRIKLLKLAVSMHLYSPRIEMYSQISKDKSFPCPTVVEIFDRNICSVTELESLIQNKTIGYESSEIFSLDYHYPGSENKSIIAILYGELGTKEFTLFHNVLKEYAERDEVDYIFRHYVKNRTDKHVRLSGYGVELQMKSTEYKAQDDSLVNDKNSSQEEEEDEVEGFIFNKLKSLYPTEFEELDKIKQTLLQSSDELTPLKVWQFQELGVQAVQRIMDTPLEDALNTFIHIAQSFPTQTRSLVDVKVNPELKKEIHRNQDKFLNSLNLQATDTALFLNGIFFDIDAVDFMAIFDVVRQEIRVMEALYSIGINERKLMSSILSLKIFDGTGKKYGLDCRDTAVVWINDIENDQRYRRWSSNLMDLLRPMFPGMMRSVRRNIFNLVIICDPASKKSWPLLKMAESFIVHNAPIRVGIVFSTPPIPISGLESASVALLNAFNYVAEYKTTFEALGFITEVYASIKEDRDVEVQDVKKKLEANYYGVNVDDVFGSGSDYNTGRHLAADFIARSGLRNLPQALVNGVPLSEESLNQEEFEDAMVAEISVQTPPIQKAVFKDELKNEHDVFEYIMSKSTIMPRLNTRVLNKENNKFLDLTDESAHSITQNINYVRTKSSRHPILFTYWIIGDFETEQGTSLLNSALEYLEESDSARIGVIANPLNLEEEGYNKIITAFMIQKSRTADELSRFLDKKIGAEEIEIDIEEVNRVREIQRKYLKKVSIAKPGETVIICNGRVIGPFEKHEEFTMADFQLLEKHSTDAYVEKIHNVVKSTLEKDESEEKWNIFMKAVSLLTSKSRSNTRFDIPEFSDKYSVIKLPPRSDTEEALEIVVIVDPVSRGAQKVGPIVSILQKVLNTNVRIFMNCVERVSDLPLKSYYRFVLEPEVKFNEDGSLYDGPMAIFTNVSPTSLLTQNMHVPDNWLVESISTLYDLDNIRLDHVQSNVHSQFELEYLLLEGHCFDTAYGSPPRGLQITLGTIKDPVIVDTIVMANLGYFQLKANPGSWILRLREGRSSELYDIVSHGTDQSSKNNSRDIKVFISSFQSNVMKLKVAKKPGKSNEDLLSDDTESSGLWNSITSTFTGSGNEEAVDETINVFSLASGHLYERFLKIMMLSVLKNTKHPVKFWFLKNYLSPTFKDILPKMSKAYNFQYELVQYKWPRWLHQQSEKQRTIWGYKILFLDVLFPLSVKKIIFVDADQIVRADLKELIDLDLQGAPYGYTPFCESRKEMEGFRFWKQGYWKSHLQGRRYHISALYVVDLKRFRKIAAGDRLRGQYQALSQDPNSLSNLDQDLPNNMIHQVPIKSLPQEWLWCETWCDDKSKDDAKTIDMCNNPLTKEAKLTAAMRIAPEWTEYDNEIKKFQMKMADEDIQFEEIIEVEDVVKVEETISEKEDKHTEL